MIAKSLLRGIAAGAVAGLLAGLFALVFAEPSIEAAIALEEAAASAGDTASLAEDGTLLMTSVSHQHVSAHDHADPRATVVPHSHGEGGDGISRETQKLGLVIGMMLYGIGLGSLFGIMAAWARGRLSGDAWTRALKLGLVTIAVVVALPAMKYPANPPAVGAPATVGTRTALFLCLWAFGALLASAAWLTLRMLSEKAWSRAASQTLVGALVLVAGGAALRWLPDLTGAGSFPADLLWSFRLWSMATQILLIAGIAAGYGLLAQRAESPARWSATPARA